MTTPAPRQPGRFARYSSGIYAALLLTYAVLFVLPSSLPLDIAGVVTFAGIITMMVVSDRHIRGLRPQDRPADGAARAARTRAFTVHHVILLGFPVFLAAFIGTAIFATDTPLMNTAAVILLTVQAVWGLAEHRHGQLRPWCPYCRRRVQRQASPGAPEVGGQRG